MEKKKKKRAWQAFGVILSLFCLTLAAIVSVALKGLSFESEPLDLSDEELGIEQPLLTESEIAVQPDGLIGEREIFNIALFGLDRRDAKRKDARSDSMMIATIDLKHKKIKLTSLLRDQAVYVEGHGEDKLNHAYAYGGPELALRTINENFGLDVRHYATVDFFTFEKAIDALGGVKIDVQPKEVALIDKHAKEIAEIEGYPYVPYTMGERLSGQKAVSYSRIRYVGDGDFERTERQRRVLASVFDEMKEKNVLQLAGAWLKVAPFIETSLSKKEALQLAQVLEDNRDLQREEMRFPLDDTWSGRYLANGMWVMQFDLKLQKERVQRYIYEDIHPTVDVQPKD